MKIMLICLHCKTKTLHKIHDERKTFAHCIQCGSLSESCHGEFREDEK